jgi:streptomycin 6-kinase
MPFEEIPPAFRELVAGRAAEPYVSGDDWLRTLPGLVDGHLGEWALEVDGPAWFGECALVVPVRRGRERLVLKLTWPHAEAEQEHLALRAWNGRGAVRLVAADPSAFTMLLERLDGDTDLSSVPILEACEVLGGLFRRLDQPALPQLPRLSVQAARWAEQLGSPPPALPRRLATQARSLLGDLTGDGQRDTRLVHSDLHYANVLAGQREPWLAIDPKAMAAEWAYAVAPAVWNRSVEAARAHNLRLHLRLRADLVAEAAGLDGDRVRAWTFVRLVVNALWASAHLPESAEFHGRMIAAAKSFAD